MPLDRIGGFDLSTTTSAATRVRQYCSSIGPHGTALAPKAPMLKAGYGIGSHSAVAGVGLRPKHKPQSPTRHEHGGWMGWIIRESRPSDQHIQARRPRTSSTHRCTTASTSTAAKIDPVAVFKVAKRGGRSAKARVVYAAWRTAGFNDLPKMWAHTPRQPTQVSVLPSVRHRSGRHVPVAQIVDQLLKIACTPPPDED